MKIEKLEICIENFNSAAMVDNRTHEVSDILRKLATRIEEGGVVYACDGLRLRDSNGSLIGMCEVEWSN